MIRLSTLRDAAFWDKVVCLDCGAQQPDDADPETHDCAFCDSPSIFPADQVLAIWQAVDDGEA